MGIDRVVCGLAAMDGLHGEGMPEDKRDACVGTEVGEPVPGEQTFDRDDQSLLDTGQWLSERSRGRSVMLRCTHDLAALVEDADVHGPRVQVDAAVKWVLRRVKSH